MASFAPSLSSSFVGAASTTFSFESHPTTAPSRSSRMVPVTCLANKKEQAVEEQQMWRRSMVAGASAAVFSVFASGAVKALEKRPAGEVKPGSQDALKKYANICVAQPTASICHG